MEPGEYLLAQQTERPYVQLHGAQVWTRNVCASKYILR
jgi:hypothetical protein